jgi:hypothetical protein
MTEKRRYRARVWVLYICFLLIAQEVFFRVVCPVPEIANFNRIDYTPLQVAPEALQEGLLSRASYTIGSEPDDVAFVHQLNLYGFRDAEWPVSSSTPRVMFVGDSFTEGFMADGSDTIPSAFNDAATASGRVLSVMNMGIGGAGLEQYCNLIRDAVPIFQPEYVVLILYTNDVPTTVDASSWFEDRATPQRNSRWMPRGLHTAIRLINREGIPLAWHRPPFPFFSPVPAESNPWSSAEVPASVYPDIADSMRRGTFNPHVFNELVWSEGFLRNSMDILPHLKAIKEYVSDYGTRVSVVYMPDRHSVSDAYRGHALTFSVESETTSFVTPDLQGHGGQLAAIASQLDTPFLDFTPLLMERETRGVRCFHEYDAHLLGETYTFVGQTLYDWWDLSAGRTDVQ